MKLFSISTSSEALQSTGGSSYISKSGIYDITIKFASLEVSKNGAQSVNFNIEHNGNSQTFYGPYITSTKGEPLKIGMQIINSLGIIAGLGEDDELTLEQDTFKVGKDNKEKEFNIIPQFSDLECKIRVQEEYSRVNGNGDIRKNMNVRGFYAANGASAQEIVDKTEAGAQLTKDEAYASNVTYQDGLTAEDIEAWKAAKAEGKDAPKSTAPAAAIKPVGSVFKK